jgi:hypothetical protein
MTDVPESVRNQELAAEAAWKAAYAEPTETADTDALEQPDAEPAPAPATETQPAPVETEWKHRYDVLKGKYDAEVPRLHEESRYWREQAMTALQQQAAQPAPEPATPAIQPDTALVDLLGDEAAAAVAALMDKQRQDFEAKLQQTQQLAGRTVQDRFWEKVRSAFPNYAEMQNDSALNGWLAQPWPGSRQPRLNEANAAFSNLDAEAFIALLSAYQPPAAPAAPSPRTPPPPTPRRAAGSGTPPPDKAAFSPANYHQQMQRVMQMRSSGRYAEADALEKSLDTAASESLRGAA